MTGERPRVLTVLGPTASGKTALAIRLAQALNGEVISADSRCFYKELNIGVAKPRSAEMMNVPHHLINVTTLEAPWSLGEFGKAVSKLIPEICSRGHLPIIAGGTGQYLRALSENWQIPRQTGNENLRIALERWGEALGFENLHTKLSLIDPIAASKIDYRNHRRVVRAWEVFLMTGKRFSDSRGKTESPYRQLNIGLEWPRELLYERVDQRIDAMLSAGWVAEVSDLIAAGKEEALRRVGVIGYNEILDYLAGKQTLKESVALIKRNTRRYIRHQANWFKPNNPDIYWLKATDPDFFERALDQYRIWISA